LTNPGSVITNRDAMESKIKPVHTIRKFLSGIPLAMVALGDSLTYGWMVDRGCLDFLGDMMRERFPEARFRLIHCGMPAGTAYNGLHRLQRDVLGHNPDCDFVRFGFNDAFCGHTSEEFRDNIEGIIGGIREQTRSEIVPVTSVCLKNEGDNAHVER